MVGHGYGTHTLMLMASIYVTQGPILELGMGLFSTGLMDNISNATYRYVLSADDNVSWYNTVQPQSEAICHAFEVRSVELWV